MCPICFWVLSSSSLSGSIKGVSELSCIFLVTALEAAFSIRILGFFYWETILQT